MGLSPCATYIKLFCSWVHSLCPTWRSEGVRKQCTMPTSIDHLAGTSLWWPKSSSTHCSPTDDMKNLAQWNKEEWGVKGRKKPPLISPQGGSHSLCKEKYFPPPIRSPSPHTYRTTMDMLPRYPPTHPNTHQTPKWNCTKVHSLLINPHRSIKNDSPRVPSACTL